MSNLKYLFVFITCALLYSCNKNDKTNSLQQENNGNYIAKINFKKSDIDKCYIGTLEYHPRINQESQLAICISDNIKSDFSNVDQVKLDTILLKNKNKVFPIIFGSSGKKIIRGFVLERYPKNPADTVLINQKKIPFEFYETKTYFEEKLDVK